MLICDGVILTCHLGEAADADVAASDARRFPIRVPTRARSRASGSNSETSTSAMKRAPLSGSSGRSFSHACSPS